jgi:predicted RNase H-like nuclease
VAGIDGCPGGWIAVLLDVTGQKPPMVQPLLGFWDILRSHEQASMIAVDMPIGFPDQAKPGGRKCEQAARKQLGARSSSVFSAPCRGALIKSRYEDASNTNAKSAEGAPKLTRQSFGLFPKMREIDARITPEQQERIFETHPELAFTIMRNGTPCIHSKKTPEGDVERRAELRSIGFSDDFLNQVLPTNVKATRDDLLDACACAWVAQRALLGAAIALPDQPETDDHGLQMMIRV